MSDNNLQAPTWELKAVGRGSFATVYVLTGHPIAFKVVLFDVDSDKLRTEFTTLQNIYQSCNSTAFFHLPRPLAFYNPTAVDQFYAAPASSPRDVPTRRPPRPDIALEDMQLLELASTAYAMDHVRPLPLSVARNIRQFYPPNTTTAPNPSLCRLYFGKKIIESRRIMFFNSSNFPLDPTRYQMVASARPEFPNIDEVAEGMGEMLSRLHFLGKYDGRDVEFVMGGASFSGVGFYVIDFNQTRHWNLRGDEIPVLVQAFFGNDPYYPRPRPGETLYDAFKNGYMCVCGNNTVFRTLGETFLAKIEEEQAKRDADQSSRVSTRQSEGEIEL